MFLLWLQGGGDDDEDDDDEDDGDLSKYDIWNDDEDDDRNDKKDDRVRIRDLAALILYTGMLSCSSTH